MIEPSFARQSVRYPCLFDGVGDVGKIMGGEGTYIIVIKLSWRNSLGGASLISRDKGWKNLVRRRCDSLFTIPVYCRGFRRIKYTPSAVTLSAK